MSTYIDLRFSSTAGSSSSQVTFSAQSSFGYRGATTIDVDFSELVDLQRNLRDLRDEEAFGKCLFETFFCGPVAEVFFLTIGAARARGEDIRIFIHESVEVPRIASLLWELLVWPSQALFLSFQSKTSITRGLGRDEIDCAIADGLPIRVVVASASPNDSQRIPFDDHFACIENALNSLTSQGLAAVEHMSGGNLAAFLDRSSRKQPIHILHVICHGEFDEKTFAGKLYLEREDCSAQMVEDSSLAFLVASRPELQLVVLSSCDSAQYTVEAPFAGVARRLSRAGIPRVIAMRSPVTSVGAVEMARYFYRSLAEDGLFSRAVSSFRRALIATASREWSIPVAFSRTKTDQIFEVPRDLGHPLRLELRELDRCLSDGRLTDAAARISVIQFGRLAGDTAQVWALKQRVAEHRRGGRRALSDSELRRALEEFLASLRALR